ncbi:cytochrome c [Porticoccaceae bacterium]|nr:cytochrome c [Porticoccaceae bacterium]
MSTISLLFTLVGVLLLSQVAVAEPLLKGVTDPQRAAYNWMMKCQGCHQADAVGKGGTPNMVGSVAKFLHLDEGRAYLGRVPGVAFVDLPEKEVAELLNWMVQTFDEKHMPENFVPYNTEEVKQLKIQPLISRSFGKRKELLQLMQE